MISNVQYFPRALSEHQMFCIMAGISDFMGKAICVQYVRGTHSWEEGPLSGQTWNHKWWFGTKWEAVNIEDWYTYYDHIRLETEWAC